MKDEKLEKLLDLAKQIGELYPNGNTTLMIHGFEIKSFDEDKWEVSATWNSTNKSTYLTAIPKEVIKGVSLTLFD